MFSRSSQLESPDKYYSDSLLIKPTFSQTIFHNLAAGAATPTIAASNLDSVMSNKPQGEAVSSILDAVNLENETPGIGTFQYYAGEAANMIGFGLNPMSWGIGELGAVAGGALSRGIGRAVSKVAPDAATMFLRKPISELLSQPVGKYIPSMVGKEGAEKPLSFSLLGEKSLETFGTFAGVGVPQGIADNYRQDTNHIEWGGVAREAGEMGAFGIAIGAIPFTWGVLRGKINRGAGRDPDAPIDRAVLDEALKSGHITKDEHQWYLDYVEHRNNPADEVKANELKDRGSRIINQNGHVANTVTNEALFEILSPKDIDNLHGAIADQIAGGVPEQYNKALSDYIIHNRMDYIRQDPKSLDGVRGYVDFINQKLKEKPSKLAEADRILDDHMLKGVKENMPFSQKEMFKMMKKSGFESSHIQHLPITIPENMVQHLKLLKKIAYLKDKTKKLEKKGKPVNKQTLSRISELEGKLPKILTPKEELTHIKDYLLRPEGLPKNWEKSNAYHRLVDLSNVWRNARSLLDRVHLDSEYSRQEAFRDLSHQTLRIADSDMSRISNPDNVIDYLKRRIEGTLTKVEPMSEVKTKLDESQKIPQDADAVLDEQSRITKDTKAEDAKTDFQNSTDKYREFKNSSDNIFKNLISCVLGGFNG